MSVLVNSRTARLANRLGSTRFSFVNRFAKRIVRRATGNKLLVETHGVALRGPVEAWGVITQVAEGRFEPFESDLFRTVLRPNMRVLDVGANIGYYTLLAARAVGPAGNVLALEPDPRTVPYLRANIQDNRFTNVTVVEGAASDHSGRSVFRQSAIAGHSGLHPTMTDAMPNEIDIVTTRIDDLRPGVVDVAKIDIEGGEPAALRGMTETLASSSSLRLFIEFNPIALEVAGNDPPAFIRWLRANFAWVALIDEHTWSLQSLSGFPTRLVNLFCSRVASDRADMAQERQ
jgi:FkbM family methyltransferase